jgi:DNA-binding response OmpR family regulator
VINLQRPVTEIPSPATFQCVGWRQRRDALSESQTLVVRMTSSVRGAERFLRSFDDGDGSYIVSSVNGQVSVRVRLEITGVGPAPYESGLPNHSLYVDWARATVQVGDNRVSLSRTELRLFGALVGAAGAPVTRLTLIEQTWPSDSLPPADRANALAVYICSLRKHLTAIGLGTVLETVRGVGYRFRTT